MEFKQSYIIGMVIGAGIIIADIALFYGKKFFIPLLIVGVTIAWLLPWADYFLQSAQKKDYEPRFLEFVRNLTGAIKSGMPTSKAIIHVVRNSDYGALNKHLHYLSNQVEWSIPVHRAFFNFSKRVDNPVIGRAIATVIEAEEAGGNMEDVLESITTSLMEIKKIRDQRRAAIHAQVIQSYIIYFVFLGVMVVIQSLLIPYLGKMQGADITEGNVGGTFASFAEAEGLDLSSVPAFLSSLKPWLMAMPTLFTMLVIVQGFFAGIIIGKLSEGDLTSGFKHSIVLVTIALFVMTLFG